MNLTNSMNNSDDNIKRIINLMQTDKSINAPADAIKWSKNIFRTRAVQPKKSVVQKVLAVLQMDLSPTKAAFGERSASATSERQMLFEAGDSSVDLRISKIAKGNVVKGQILGSGYENSIVRLGDLETTANELSEFKFEVVPNGKYDMTLRTAETEILLEGIEIE